MSTTIPPYNEDAEDRVVGAAISSERALQTVAETLNPQHLYQPRHQRILAAALTLNDLGLPVDIVTLGEHLAEGDFQTARELHAATYPTSNVAHHCQIVEDYATRRKLIDVGQTIASSGWEPDGPIVDMLGNAEQAVYDLTSQAEPGELRPIRETLEETFLQLDRPGGEITGTPTGLTELDRITAGLQPGNLVLIAARPGMGKSALAIQTAHHNAVKHHAPIALFTLEMSAQEINQRILSIDSSVTLMRIRTRSGLTPLDRDALNRSRTTLEAAPLHTDDTVSARIIDIRARCRRLKQRQPDLALVVVDYLQLMLTDTREDNRNLEVSRISRGLKLLARELHVPIIALSQLNRNVEHRGKDATPILSDLRDSGSLEQDADLVIFINRKETEEGDITAQLTVAKHRNGPTGETDVAWIRRRAMFGNLHVANTT